MFTEHLEHPEYPPLLPNAVYTFFNFKGLRGAWHSATPSVR